MSSKLFSNKRSAVPWVWSYDRGDMSTEKLAMGFRGKVTIHSVFDPTGDNITTPSAYLTVDEEYAVMDEKRSCDIFLSRLVNPIYKQ